MDRPSPLAAPTAKPRIRRRPTIYQEGPDPIDVHVGARMRLRRVLMGLSQQALGDAVLLTFQQIQKYERGSNRISASTLHRLAEALNVPVSFFFDGIGEGPTKAPQDDNLMRRESLDLLRHYYRMSEPIRRQVYVLVKAMGRNDGNGECPAEAEV